MLKQDFSIMDNIIDLGELEFNMLTANVVYKSTRILENALKTAIQDSYIETTKSTGALLKYSAPVYPAKSKSAYRKKGLLLKETSVGYSVDKDTNLIDKLLIYGPRHAFILNYGVKTIATSKKNKRKNYLLDVKETNHIPIAIERSNVVQILANDLAEIKANQVANIFSQLPDTI